MSTGWIVVLVIAALLLLLYAAYGVRSVPSDHSGIVERLGRFHVDRGVEQVTVTVIGDALRDLTPAATVAARPDAVRTLRRELAALEDRWGLRIPNARIDLVEPEPARVRKDPHL